MFTRVIQFALVAATVVSFGSLKADPDPKVLAYKLPQNIKWVTSPSGSSQAVLSGDPEKPGLYVILVKWSPHHMSRPHWHANDRLVTVISGTWWVGTGPKYAPDTTVAMPAGTFVTHYGKQIHYDGAKDEECTLQIVGMGPATSTPAETK
jgi:hypothetical protein